MFNPTIELLTVERGGVELERKRHEQFKDEHLAFEWFRLSERLDDWIKAIQGTHDMGKRGDLEWGVNDEKGRTVPC